MLNFQMKISHLLQFLYLLKSALKQEKDINLNGFVLKINLFIIFIESQIRVRKSAKETKYF